MSINQLHWEGGGEVFPQVPFRRLFQPTKISALPEDEIVTAFTDGQVTLRSNRNKIGYHEAADTSTYLRVNKGDLVVHGLDILRGSVGVSDSTGAISAVCTVCPPSPIADGKYVSYVIRIQALSGYTKALARGIREGGADFRRWETLGELPILMPTLQEQKDIATFLDMRCIQIDEAIKQKENQKKAVNDYFDALVRDKILGDPTKSKSSPEWASHIGEDRSLIPLGRLVQIRGEKNDPITVTEILSLTASRGVILYSEKGAVGNIASEDISRYNIVRIGDLVINSMNVIIGSVGYSKYEGVLSPVYYVLKPLGKDLIDMEYLAFHFRIREFQRQLIRLGYGILDHRMRIPWINLKTQDIIVPNIQIQRRVTEELRELDSSRLMALDAIDKSMGLLEDYKVSLITEYVTGKTRVGNRN